MRMAALGLCLLLILSTAPGCSGSKVVTTSSLLNELTDLQGLAEYPDTPFTCRQFSSYDRRSKAPDQPEPPQEGWFANGDFSKYLRVEENAGRKEFVMMDAEGPGAVVRIWSANPKGNLRFYLDGNEEPALTVAMTDMLGGKVPGIPNPIAGVRSKGWNCHFPIPYATHCKVTCDSDGFYYHVNYRTYQPGTKVESFTEDQLEVLQEQAKAIADQLAAPKRLGPFAKDPAFSPARSGPSCTVTLRPNESRSPVKLYGSHAIRLAARVRAHDTDQALRDVILKIRFDGDQTVVCPIGDFFGAAPGINPYQSLPMGVTDSGIMWSHWFMPFKESAEIEVHNMGKQSVRLNLQTERQKYKWTDRSMHFHAKWRMQRDVPTRPMIDWNYLTANGKGVFVGASFSIANPTKAWWGEGDEKIYVDGEAFPSHFGTGTEDYFGYAWCSNLLFTHAYHNQPRCDGPGNYGYTSVNRWHIIDCIPFTSKFKFDMELWHWEGDRKVDMAVVSYWYALPGATDVFPPINSKDLPIRIMPEYILPYVEGAIEGEKMKIISMPDHALLDPQTIGACSSESHMWWHQDVRFGDKIELGFEVPAAGRHQVIARFVMAKDYGISRLTINGQQVKRDIDLYNNGVIASEEMNLGSFDLVAGQNNLVVEMVGANDKAVKSYLFGLDYLRLQPD